MDNKEFKSLVILDKFKILYAKFGVDYKVMRSILKVKLTMDKRRVPTILNDYDKKGKDNKSNLVMIYYLFIGFFLSFFRWYKSKYNMANDYLFYCIYVYYLKYIYIRFFKCNIGY